MSGSRIGCDIIQTDDIASSIAEFGDRYLKRVYTAHELETCAGPAMAQRLAARFAAKEATAKVLRSLDAALPWTNIEVRREPWGGCSIALHGGAARTARHQGLYDLQVSLSHEPGIAMAVVTAAVSAGPVTPSTESA